MVGPGGPLGRTYPLDLLWVAFVGINLAAMRLLPAWRTVPFLAIWVSLAIIYGLRLWRLQPTILTLAAVTLATGGIVVVQVLKGQQDAGYLGEVPLVALMFLVLVGHGRRRTDRDRLALALDALLENVIAHTGSGDQIEVSARREDGGFGLGLAIVQAIAPAHQGSVQVRSTPGRGSSFELILPLGATVAAVREPVMTSSGPGSRSARVGAGSTTSSIPKRRGRSGARGAAARR